MKLHRIAFALIVFSPSCSSNTIIRQGDEPTMHTAQVFAERGELLSIKPRFSGRGEVRNVSKGDWNLSLRPGSYTIIYSCEQSEISGIRINESETFRYIKVRAGKKYQLYCDKVKFGVMHVKEI